MRLMARIKMAYYPTPVSVVERIKTFIRFTDGCTILDPCCGEGNALAKLAEGTNAKTFGIEIDGHRAEGAKTKLHFVLKCGYEQTRISNSCFSCLFLNPPYDWETEDEGNERKEKVFLKETMKYLKPKGLLVYIIPQSRLDKGIAKILAYRFENFLTFKFPVEEYEAFKQIVLFAVKKKENGIDEEALAKLIQVPSIELKEIPSKEEPVYELPSSKEIPLFRSTVIDEEELEKEVAQSPLWEKFKELARVEEQKLENPPLPLHTGHLGLLLANGCLDGIVGKGQDMHIVKGKVEKIVNKYTELKGEVVEERELEQYKVSIKILKQDGEIITLL
jgi:SAM-dependent methyltransferase